MTTNATAQLDQTKSPIFWGEADPIHKHYLVLFEDGAAFLRTSTSEHHATVRCLRPGLLGLDHAECWEQMYGTEIPLQYAARRARPFRARSETFICVPAGAEKRDTETTAHFEARAGIPFPPSVRGTLPSRKAEPAGTNQGWCSRLLGWLQHPATTFPRPRRSSAVHH